MKNPNDNQELEIHSASDWIACHECDALHEVIELPVDGKAECSQCGSELYRQINHSLDKVLVFSLTALLLFVLSHLFPFLSMKMGERIEENVLVSATLELLNQGFPELAVLVFLTSILFPFLVIAGLLYVVLPLIFDRHFESTFTVFRWVKKLFPWSLVGVFMLGVLVAIVKLMDLATVIPGPSLFFMAGLLVTMVAAQASLDERLIWHRISEHSTVKGDEHHPVKHGLASCSSCHLVLHNDQYESCPRCGEKLSLRKTDSVSRTWALLFTAALLYIPANIYPIMTVTQFGRGNPDTIISGVVHLIEAQLWGLALLVFFASIMVPVLKLLIMAYLLISIQFKSCWRPKDRTLLFRVTEVVGAWSMIDIFLIGILISLVKLDAFATIEAGPGATFFAAVVVITLFAAHSFDSRLIWDNCRTPHE
jgi:paraquat-inducible protein A